MNFRSSGALRVLQKFSNYFGNGIFLKSLLIVNTYAKLRFENLIFCLILLTW
jgi:hypothetical protein